MLEVDSSGDYAGSRASSRLALMTSSRRHLSADVRLSDDDDDECDYASAGTRSTLLDGDMGSYEAFTEYDFGSNLHRDDGSDDFCYGVASRRLGSVDYSSFGNNMMTKSLSMPSHSLSSDDFIPDPFPELTKSQLAPVSARIYSLNDMSSKPAEDPMMSRPRGAAPSGSTGGTHRPPLSEPITIRVFTDESSCSEVSIDGCTTAVNVCDQLVQRNQALPSPQWTLVENIRRYRLERGIEHHEVIYDVYSTWTADEDCRFTFRKDFTKYELFRNPTQFFPEHMVDCKLSVREDGWLTRSERYKNLLLQNLLANQSIPDIQGYLHIRDKRSWKKHFCVLRGSGLYYSTKGTLKDPQYLVLISTLEDVNIYTSHNTKKVFGAPTNYGFCLKPANGPSDAKQFKLCSAEDEQSRLCWLTGLRFVKYGAQLRENFRLTLRCEEEISKSNAESSSRQNGNAIYIKSRVPMDFSGERGHVVTDPNEALSIAFEEAYNWRKKALMRNPPKPAQSCNSNSRMMEQVAAVSQALSARQYPLQIAGMIHLMQPWFHGNISRDEAVRLICEQGLVDGVFLVRNSQSLQNVFVLSFAHNQKVKHCTINKIAEGDGHTCYSLDGGTTKFMDLIQLVDFYQLNAGALPTRLTYHVTRL